MRCGGLARGSRERVRLEGIGGRRPTSRIPARARSGADTEAMLVLEPVVHHAIVPEPIAAHAVVPEPVVPHAVVPDAVVHHAVVPHAVVPEPVFPQPVVPKPVVPNRSSPTRSSPTGRPRTARPPQECPRAASEGGLPLDLCPNCRRSSESPVELGRQGPRVTGGELTGVVAADIGVPGDPALP